MLTIMTIVIILLEYPIAIILNSHDVIAKKVRLSI